MIAYLLENMWQLWAVVAVLGLMFELTSGDFFIVCFSIGACAAAIVSPFAGLYVQLIVFGVVTALSIYQVRPFALRYLHRNEENRVSNADALIGRQGHVTETIQEKGFGRVAIDGDDWKAVSEDGSVIEKGDDVEIIKLDSIIVTVRKCN